MRFVHCVVLLACLINLNGAIAKLESFASSKQIQVGKDLGVLRLDPQLNEILSPDAVVKVLASGFSFIEGPVWNSEKQVLLFSDVVTNKIYEWDGNSIRIFLNQVFPESPPRGHRRISSNGLTFDKSNHLVIADMGYRQITRFDSELKRTPIVSAFEGRRFNSPNDLMYDSKGNLYFTDPPYGLDGLDESTLKELNFNGVYRLDPAGNLDLLSSGQNRPNGLALSPDEDWLYVANSDATKIWMAYQLSGSSVQSEKIFFDAGYIEAPGVPDGMKVDNAGNIFATGPGGVLVISAEGEHLGTISTGEITANVGWGGAMPGDRCGSKTLYMTASTSLYSIDVRTGGCSPGK